MIPIPSTVPTANVWGRFVIWLLFFASHGLAMLWLAWHFLAHINFAYPLLYRHLGIGQFIQKYAPHHSYKQGFEALSAPMHWDLFAQINTAIHRHGQGLAGIRYPRANGASTALLSASDVHHLELVSQLIDRFNVAGYAGLLLWLGMHWWLKRRQQTLPALPQIFKTLACVLVVMGLSLAGIGFEAFFDQFHDWAFPAGHHYIFSRYRSLMICLMPVDDFFLYIGLFWLAGALALWIGTLYAMQWTLGRR